jgi:thiamine-monophosphate kinase
MSSEFERITRLRSRFEHTPAPSVLLAIGDDAAVLAPSALARVWTVDSAVEEVHFSRAFMALPDVGYRAFMAAASDVAAMGGQAVAALSALSLPAELSDDELDQLAAGLDEAARACHCPIVGGNLARARELSLTTTVLGECAGPVLRRDGAQPGDGLFVTGTIGGAALGLLALRSGRGSEPALAHARARFLRPRARFDLAAAVAARAHACIDVSDGLAQDLRHLCEASSVAAVLELPAVPRLAAFERLAAQLGADPVALLLAGGEDYELLFTAPVGAVPSELATLIGRIDSGAPELRVLDVDGHVVAPKDGYDHFR